MFLAVSSTSTDTIDIPLQQLSLRPPSPPPTRPRATRERSDSNTALYAPTVPLSSDPWPNASGRLTLLDASGHPTHLSAHPALTEGHTTTLTADEMGEAYKQSGMGRDMNLTQAILKRSTLYKEGDKKHMGSGRFRPRNAGGGAESLVRTTISSPVQVILRGLPCSVRDPLIASDVLSHISNLSLEVTRPDTTWLARSAGWDVFPYDGTLPLEEDADNERMLRFGGVQTRGKIGVKWKEDETVWKEGAGDDVKDVMRNAWGGEEHQIAAGLTFAVEVEKEPCPLCPPAGFPYYNGPR
ncbi:hypothetical protein IAT38_001080 [Cryptococcus sp. DSM 104549]